MEMFTGGIYLNLAGLASREGTVLEIANSKSHNVEYLLRFEFSCCNSRARNPLFGTLVVPSWELRRWK